MVNSVQSCKCEALVRPQGFQWRENYIGSNISVEFKLEPSYLWETLTSFR